MPTYEYECPDCKQVFEKFQYMKDDPLKECLLCGKPRVKRLISAGGGILFKGSGFYQTDYRSSDYNKRASTENKAGTENKANAENKAGTENKANAPADSAKETKKSSDKGSCSAE